MHKEKQKVCKCFVVPGSGPVLLGMTDVETLSVLTIRYNTIGRQLTSDDKAKAEGWKLERYAYNTQDVDVQNNVMETMQLTQMRTV